MSSTNNYLPMVSLGFLIMVLKEKGKGDHVELYDLAKHLRITDSDSQRYSLDQFLDSYSYQEISGFTKPSVLRAIWGLAYKHEERARLNEIANQFLKEQDEKTKLN